MKQRVDWHAFWAREGNPGFHEVSVNRNLEAHFPIFNLPPGATIFLPLCGKSVDMLWLSQRGFKVVGVELSEKAIRAFFDESGLEYQIEQHGPLRCFSAGGIKIYQGNFMHISQAHLSTCDLVYDRAALVAIEKDNRPLYAEHMKSLVPRGTPMLVVALEYDQSVMTGPPFSVPPEEVKALYQPQYQVHLLEQQERIDAEPRWRSKGLDSFKESVLRLQQQ